ncbi:glycosyltransferase family 2 protein [Blastococcus sp. SYSU D00820]
MTAPLVSILVPTYNGERFLKKTLRSALEQTYKEIEVVVADDASTDSTPEILAAAAEADPRIRVIRHESNVGAFRNPALLLEAARGEYVKFLLHDDLLMRDCVKDLVRGMEATEGATLAFSRRSIVGADGRPVPGGELQPLQDRPGPLEGLELGNALLENCVNLIGELSTVLFRRTDVDPDTLWEVDGRQLRVLGDLHLSVALLAKGRAFYSPRTLSSFRLHDTQRSQDPRMTMRSAHDWVLLVDWGRRHGFLPEEAQQRKAFSTALRVAAEHYPKVPTGAATPGLEAAFLATVALAELDGALAADPGTPLYRRAHGPGVLGRLSGELDGDAA